MIVCIMYKHSLASFIARFLNRMSSRCSLDVRLHFITLFRSLSVHVHSALLYTLVLTSIFLVLTVVPDDNNLLAKT